MKQYLAYRPPYQWRAMLAFLAARAVPATESIDGEVYRRSMRAGRADGSGGFAAGVVEVRHRPRLGALEVALSPGLGPHAPEVLARIAHLFDLGCDPAAVGAVLGELARGEPGLRLPGAVDPFEIAVRAILGQQITVAAARTLATRFVARFGVPLPHIASPQTAPGHLFPDAATIAALEPSLLVAQLGEMGIIRARGQAIADVARAIVAGALPLADGPRLPSGHPDIEPALAALMTIRGIGPWTAHYVVMRALGWADAFPPGDVAARKALGAATPAAALALAQRWQPWRGYALMHLWRQGAA